MELIRLENITKTFKQGDLETKVLKGINLSINEGDFVAIMGPSGSGKSTLMYIIGFLDKPTSGKYYFKGKDVSSFDDDTISKLRGRHIGFVFQSFYLVPYLTVKDNVLLPTIYLKGEDRKEVFKNINPEDRAINLLTRLGLKERINFRPDQLSGGQKQRVAIARALINSPSLIIADEPTGALDQASGKAVMNIFKELNEEGRTILIVTHDPEIARYAKRIIRIKDGVIEG
ncbi:ABC transporter ATP-binding protein [Desulfurobacterium atlanticum]|uniref:Putative ABC transport system ATP-binding protein n=1 Tax=Desulfurobacterium atlanticum TaxID=240169 RepID=A0A238YHW5_9BACT|nr:ABC transporter ATP-binding protein [Desulfurobacterium atlanticum]SNR70727.1 putative ABC transport system ATP-binding protein [Desulfurobacterium atlanticum]